MEILILMTTLVLVCFAASIVFKVLELMFRLLNRLVVIIDWALNLCGKFGALEYNMTKESVCYARRLGTYYGFLELQKMKLSMRLRSTSRFF